MHKWRPLFIRLKGDFTLGWNTACWLWVRGQMIGELFSDKMKIQELIIQLQQHTELTVILFLYHFISLWPFTLSSLSLLLHIHFWHLLRLLVKLDVGRRANTEMSGVFQNKLPPDSDNIGFGRLCCEISYRKLKCRMTWHVGWHKCTVRAVLTRKKQHDPKLRDPKRSQVGLRDIGHNVLQLPAQQSGGMPGRLHSYKYKIKAALLNIAFTNSKKAFFE